MKKLEKILMASFQLCYNALHRECFCENVGYLQSSFSSEYLRMASFICCRNVAEPTMRAILAGKYISQRTNACSKLAIKTLD